MTTTNASAGTVGLTRILAVFGKLPDFPGRKIVALVVSLGQFFAFSWLYDGIMSGLLRFVCAMVITAGPTLWMYFCISMARKERVKWNYKKSQFWSIMLLVGLCLFSWFYTNINEFSLLSKGVSRIVSIYGGMAITVFGVSIPPTLWLQRKKPPTNSA